MSEEALIISKGRLQKNKLHGKVALITGAGGGIGFETARSLIWLGAKVVIAEIDNTKGKKAIEKLNAEFGEGNVCFIETDIGDEKSVSKLAKNIFKQFGKLDILVNNATITPMGAVHKVGIEKWDLSYNTNLRGPILLVREFLPEMLKANSGIVVFVPSSGAAPYMGAYEVFKTSQVELSNTLCAELENTNVVTYSIGPGIVKTETAHNAIKEIAPMYGKSVEEFYKMSEFALLTAEEAGAGFAASIALAEKYRGLETSSIQALTDAGITIKEKKISANIVLTEQQITEITALFVNINNTFTEQIGDWSNRPIFERQWLLRDFKKLMGATPDYFFEALKKFENAITGEGLSINDLKDLPLDKVYSYYVHQIDLLKGYEKNPDKVKEYTAIMEGWLEQIDKFNKYKDELLK